MFEKLAKFRPFEPQRMAPRPIAATHSNDNLPGFRHPEGRGRRPTPAPACHWVLIDGHLECLRPLVRGTMNLRCAQQRHVVVRCEHLHQRVDEVEGRDDPPRPELGRDGHVEAG
jgi:hypothetical protein